MKKIILIVSLLTPTLTKAQIAIFASGGIATNTFKKDIYTADAKMTLSPLAEIGFTYAMRSNFNFGFICRYGNLSLKDHTYIPGPFGYGSGEMKKYNPVKYTIAPMLTFGPNLNISRIMLKPSVEAGICFSKKDPSFVAGLRLDVAYNIYDGFGIQFGTSATYYKIKDYGGWYFPFKAGIRFSI